MRYLSSAPHHLLLIVLTFRIWRLIFEDEIGKPLRERLVKPDSYLGYAFSCVWCSGLWAALVTSALTTHSVTAWIVTALLYNVGMAFIHRVTD